MKKILFFILFGTILFLTSCGTNNFCRIDAVALETEARAVTLATAEKNFLRLESDTIVVSDDFITLWLAKGEGRDRVESYVPSFIADYSADETKNSEYTKAWKAKYNQLKTSCITIKDIPSETESGEVKIRAKTWIDAMKQGPIELFIIFPVSNLLIQLTSFFGGTSSASTTTIALASIASIILVTILIRTLITLATFKSTLKSQKMQELQPEVAEIQRKYSGINTQEARQKQSQEIMKLYEKHDIKMLSTLLGPFLTMPILFAMWAAINETWILKQGVLFKVNLGSVVSSNIFSKPSVFVILIYLLSIVAQFILMKLPQWRQKAKLKKKNQVMDQKAIDQQKQTRMTMYMMMAMMMFFGLSMPVGMLIYLITSNIFSIGLSFVTEHVNNKNKQRRKR